MAAAILYPGPTLVECLPLTKRYDYLVAVTDSVFADERIDAWCMYERPDLKNREDKYAGRLKELGCEVWARPREAHLWRKWSIDERLIRCDVSTDDLAEEFGWEAEAWRSEGKPWAYLSRNKEPICVGGSGFHALAQTISLGYKIIDMYGNDMDGRCNYGPKGERHGGMNSSERWWANRWTKERGYMNGIIPEAAENGVTITRVGHQ